MWSVPLKAHVFERWSQLVALCWEVVDLLGDRATLEEVSHWGMYFLFALCFQTVDTMWHASLCSPGPPHALSLLIFCHEQKASLLKLKAKIGPPSLKMPLVWDMVKEVRKVMDTQTYCHWTWGVTACTPRSPCVTNANVTPGFPWMLGI